jgi:hypothetical protein
VAVDKIYYVYEHWRPDKGVCFYVGKGKGKRAYKMTERHNPHQNIINKLKRLGMCVEVKLFASGLTEKEALEIEVSRIAHWRSIGIKLANRTNGGDGVSGLKMSKEAKLKMRVAKLGKPGKSGTTGMRFSDETRAKMSAAHIGKTKSKQHAKNARDAIWGKDYVPMTKDEKRERDNELRRIRRAKSRQEKMVLKEITQ